jgi:hypothetical protein
MLLAHIFHLCYAKMNPMSEKSHPWYGLDDVGDEVVSSFSFNDPKPLHNEKSQHEQDKALKNPEESMDKDPDKPWVQGEDKPSRDKDPGVNPVKDFENGDPPIDNWAEPGKRDDIPDAR